MVDRLLYRDSISNSTISVDQVLLFNAIFQSHCFVYIIAFLEKRRIYLQLNRVGNVVLSQIDSKTRLILYVSIYSFKAICSRSNKEQIEIVEKEYKTTNLQYIFADKVMLPDMQKTTDIQTLHCISTVCILCGEARQKSY